MYNQTIYANNHKSITTFLHRDFALSIM